MLIYFFNRNYLGCNIFHLLQELDDPLILIHDKKVSNLHAVVKVLELALKVFFISVADILLL